MGKIKEYWFREGINEFEEEMAEMMDSGTVKRFYLADEVDKALAEVLEETFKLEERFHHDSQLSYGEIFDCFHYILKNKLGEPTKPSETLQDESATQVACEEVGSLNRSEGVKGKGEK